MIATQASTNEFLLALAQGLSGLLAITAAVLTFLVERTQKRQLVGDSAYMQNLALITVVSSATALIAALTWWTWDHVATGVDLLFGLPPCVWMAVLFGGATAASLVCAVGASVLLFRHRKASRKAAQSKP